MTTATAPDPSPVAAPALKAFLPGFLTLALIWGASFLFIKVGVRELHPIYVTLGRVAVGAATLIVIVMITRDRLPRDLKTWGHLTVVAAIGVALPFTLFGYGEQRVPSLLAGIWNATTPLVTLPIAVLIFRTERLTVRRSVGIGLGFVGVLTVLGVWRGTGGTELTGQLMCFGAAACYGLAIPYLKRFVAGRTESGVALSAVQLIIATVLLAVAAPLVAGAPPSPTQLSSEVIGSVFALGALGTGVAFAINMRNIRLIGASAASTVTYLIPIVATVVGVLALDERLSWYEPVGALIVLFGVAVAQGLIRKPGITRASQPTPAVVEPARS